jgi:murein L,D-transpeptidase YafK
MKPLSIAARISRALWVGLLLAWLPTLQAQAGIDRILVDKSQRRLLLLDERDGVIRSYQVALGADPVGHKQQEGDERTPEGRYVIDFRKADSEYHRALHISYPNRADRRWADVRGVPPGGAIMIHGLPKGGEWIGWAHRARDWTDGCIAVTNDEIEEIWSLVQDGTPIEIRP